MDHGKLTDHNGKRVDFRNVILVMTSNAGASEQAKEAIGFNRILREGEADAAIEKMFKVAEKLNISNDVELTHLAIRHGMLKTEKL